MTTTTTTVATPQGITQFQNILVLAFYNAAIKGDYGKRYRIARRFPTHHKNIFKVLYNVKTAVPSHFLLYREDIMAYVLEREKDAEQLLLAMGVNLFCNPDEFDPGLKNLLHVFQSVTLAKRYLEYLQEECYLPNELFMNREDYNYETPIVHAFDIDSLELAKLYIQYGAKLNHNNRDYTWIVLSSKIKSFAMLQLFNQYCKGADFQTLINNSIQFYLRMLQFGDVAFDLIMSQVQVNWKKHLNLLILDEFGKIPLSIVKKLLKVIEEQEPNSLEQMFKNNGKKMNTVSTPMTLLMNASYDGSFNPDIFRYLVHHPMCDPFSLNSTESNALHCIAYSIEVRYLKALLTSDKFYNIDVENKNHFTPLQLVCNSTTIQYGARYADRIKLLIDYGANPLLINKTEKKNAIDILLNNTGDTVFDYIVDLMIYLMSTNIEVYYQYASQLAYKSKHPVLKLIVTRFLQNKLSPLFKHVTKQWFVDIDIVCVDRRH
jgi:hypothetical protein